MTSTLYWRELTVVHDHCSGSWLMAASCDEGWIMAAAAATGGGEASASCAASMAGQWFIALGIANEVDDVRWLIVPWHG
jgi:hypothetical protein